MKPYILVPHHFWNVSNFPFQSCTWYPDALQQVQPSGDIQRYSVHPLYSINYTVFLVGHYNQSLLIVLYLLMSINLTIRPQSNYSFILNEPPIYTCVIASEYCFSVIHCWNNALNVDDQKTICYIYCGLLMKLAKKKAVDQSKSF